MTYQWNMMSLIEVVSSESDSDGIVSQSSSAIPET